MKTHSAEEGLQLLRRVNKTCDHIMQEEKHFYSIFYMFSIDREEERFVFDPVAMNKVIKSK